MNKLNRKEIDGLINDSTNGEYSSLKAVNDSPSSNNKLASILNKIVKTLTTDTLMTSQLGEFFTSFKMGNEKLEIGALIEQLGLGILPAYDDEVKANTDLLPRINAYARQFVKDMFINVKKLWELNINNNIFMQAFTSINAFNSFINLYKQQIEKSADIWFYEFGIKDLLKNTQNTYHFSEKSLTLENFFQNVFNDIALSVPYSSDFNVGSVRGSGIILKNADATSISNGSGLNNQVNTKINSQMVSVIDGKEKYEDVEILITRELATQYNNLVLSNIYHDSYLALEKKFKKIHYIPKSVLVDLGIKTDFFMGFYSSLAYIKAEGINQVAEQLYNKGDGGYLLNIVAHKWFIMGTLPFANGRYYTGEDSAKNTTSIEITAENTSIVGNYVRKNDTDTDFDFSKAGITITWISGRIEDTGVWSANKTWGAFSLNSDKGVYENTFLDGGNTYNIVFHRGSDKIIQIAFVVSTNPGDETELTPNLISGDLIIDLVSTQGPSIKKQKIVFKNSKKAQKAIKDNIELIKINKSLVEDSVALSNKLVKSQEEIKKIKKDK